MTSGNSKISLDHVDSKFGISIHLTEEFQKFRKNICCVFTMQVHIVFLWLLIIILIVYFRSDGLSRKRLLNSKKKPFKTFWAIRKLLIFLKLQKTPKKRFLLKNKKLNLAMNSQILILWVRGFFYLKFYNED